MIRESTKKGLGSIPPNELIARVEKLLTLVAATDKYLTAGAQGDATQVDMAFEANGDVEYHLQQLLGDLKGL